MNRFAIDLYMVGGSGDCGTYVTSICDKESIGCKDSRTYAGSLSIALLVIRELSYVLF